MLTPFAPDLWLAEGPTVSVAGFHYPTRMAVIRLSDGGLFLWSPIGPEAELVEAVQQLGPVRHLVAPNSLHHLSVADWMEVCPDAQFHAAPGLAGKRKDLTVATELGDTPHPAWASEIDQVVMRGNLITTEVVFHHAPSRTVLFTDLIQHFPPDWFTGWRRVVARLDRMTAPRATVPRKFRVAFRDRVAARRGLERVLEWEPENLVMAHGAPVEGGGAEAVRHAFEWLTE